MSPKVSIIIPVYNSAKYLPSTLNSIKEDISHEIIIVDDGSTDLETIKLLKALTGKYKIIHQENAGTAAARNNGAKEARGEYLLFLDSDDLLQINYCTYMASILDNDHNLDFVYPSTILFDNEIGYWNSLEFNPILVKYYNYFVISSLIRKDSFERIGCFDPSYKQRDDREFWIRAVKNNLNGQRSDVLFFYRKLPNSKLASINKNKEIWNHEKEVRQKYKEIYKLSDFLNFQVLFYNTYIRLFYFVPGNLKKYLLTRNIKKLLILRPELIKRFPKEVLDSINSHLS